MIITSVSFLIFFLIFLFCYFYLFKDNANWQNFITLVASYFFYGWADWRMVPLLIVYTIIFYYVGIDIGQTISENNKRRAKVYLMLGVVLGVGILFFFKYLNFLFSGIVKISCWLGLQANYSSLKIILPLGVSFFTFKFISYVVEVWRGNIRPTKDFVTFATYIAFFPTIMSGPIDRPGTFIPQLEHSRHVNWRNVEEGCKRILWGLFCKMCIADVVCSYTDSVFDNLHEHSAVSIVFATVLYSFQIYADFNGYSNMAIGVGQIMGIKVMENFRQPYFADSVSDFWRRWHISLSTWIRDYIYIPLGGNRKGKVRMYVNQLVAMTLCGLWHGANLTFVVWGLLHGILVCVHKFYSQTILHHDRHYHAGGGQETLLRSIDLFYCFYCMAVLSDQPNQ
jgi:D-alanyl-lipoteichoic acid acyltransferase DltB (MBOAT superfamily)